MPDEIGVFSPVQATLIWQDYLRRQQLKPELTRNYPERRQEITETSPHRVFVKNTETEAIPAFGCMEIEGRDDIGGRPVLTVKKPTSRDGSYIFNGPYEIKPEDLDEGDTGAGWGYRYGVVIALGDAPSSVGQIYQPIPGSWELEAGGDLFECWARHETDTRQVIGRFAGGDGGDGSCNACCETINTGPIFHPDLPAGKDEAARDFEASTPCGTGLGKISVPTSDGNGRIEWQGGLQRITYESTGHTYTADISTDCIVYNNNGEDVTSGATITEATITMTFADPTSTFDVDLDATIP